MEDALFNLRFAAKQLARQAKKCEKQAKKDGVNCKKAVERGDIDGAKNHAQSAIEHKNEARARLRLSSRIDATAARVDTTVKMKYVTKIATFVHRIDAAARTMDVEKIASAMDECEQQFESLDLEYMDSSTETTPVNDQIEELIRQVADEHSLELRLAALGARYYYHDCCCCLVGDKWPYESLRCELLGYAQASGYGQVMTVPTGAGSTHHESSFCGDCRLWTSLPRRLSRFGLCMLRFSNTCTPACAWGSRSPRSRRILRVSLPYNTCAYRTTPARR